MAGRSSSGAGEGERRAATPEELREEVARLLAEVRTLEQVADALKEFALRTQAYLAELNAAGSTLEGITGQEGAEVLVPIGAGSFIRVHLATAEKAIISLGADVAVEVGLDRAKEIIGERAAEAQKALNDYLTRLREVELAIEARRRRLRALMEVSELARRAEEGSKEVPG